MVKRTSIKNSVAPGNQQMNLSGSDQLTQTAIKTRISLKPQLTQLAARGQVELLEALLEQGEDVDSPSPNGSSALVVAAKYGQLHAIKILLKYGAKTHRAAIDAAKEAGHPHIVQQIASAMLMES